MNYTKPTRLDGRWEIDEFDCSSGGEMQSVEVYKQRQNGSRGPVCVIENPDIGEAKDPGQSAGDLSLIAAAPLMYDFLKEIEEMVPTETDHEDVASFVRNRAKEIKALIEEEAENLIAEAEDAYADEGL